MERHPDPAVDEYPNVLGRRFEAMFLDGIIVITVMLALGYAAGVVFLEGNGGGFGGGLVAVWLGSPVAIPLYHFVLEGYYGQTIGKHARGLVVVTTSGSDVGWLSALVRNLLRPVDAFPGFYITGLVFTLLTGRKRRLGDLVGRTVVVHTAESAADD